MTWRFVKGTKIPTPKLTNTGSRRGCVDINDFDCITEKAGFRKKISQDFSGRAAAPPAPRLLRTWIWFSKPRPTCASDKVNEISCPYFWYFRSGLRLVQGQVSDWQQTVLRWSCGSGQPLDRIPSSTPEISEIWAAGFIDFIGGTSGTRLTKYYQIQLRSKRGAGGTAALPEKSWLIFFPKFCLFSYAIEIVSTPPRHEFQCLSVLAWVSWCPSQNFMFVFGTTPLPPNPSLLRP